MKLRFRRGKDISVAGELETRSPDGLEKPRPSSAVRAAIEVKQAALQLVKYANVVQSIGLASWSLGIAFAGAAVGLRFLNGKDMAAPEFMACFVFAGVLVLSGFICYFLESQGYIKVISEIGDAALKELESDNHEAGTNGQAHQAGITETQSGR